MNSTLVIAGCVGVAAAILGGGFEASGIAIPAINSRPKQLLVAALGGIVATIGLLADRIDKSIAPSSGGVSPPVPSFEKLAPADAEFSGIWNDVNGEKWLIEVAGKQMHISDAAKMTTAFADGEINGSVITMVFNNGQNWDCRGFMLKDGHTVSGVCRARDHASKAVLT